MKSTIELLGFELEVVIGTYKDDEIVPDKHILDLTLSIEPSLVIIEKDTMDEVFDYDPLIKCINTLAKEVHYETQEMLITLIVKECSNYNAIKGLDLFLRKNSVSRSTGKLGVRVILDEKDLSKLRQRTPSL
jgi:dihydroneopterin aldolase